MFCRNKLMRYDIIQKSGENVNLTVLHIELVWTINDKRIRHPKIKIGPSIEFDSKNRKKRRAIQS